MVNDGKRSWLRPTNIKYNVTMEIRTIRLYRLHVPLCRYVFGVMDGLVERMTRNRIGEMILLIGIHRSHTTEVNEYVI